MHFALPARLDHRLAYRIQLRYSDCHASTPVSHAGYSTGISVRAKGRERIDALASTQAIKPNPLRSKSSGFLFA
jgi:hypothetical protein